MDANECNTLISSSKNTFGMTKQELLQTINEAGSKFAEAARNRFGGKGEWS